MSTLNNCNIVSSQDYYPFGMAMSGRGFNLDKYRFGFNGQEKDREIYNNESTTTALFWEYDGRIGRRWNLDPVPQVNMSDYSCLGNNPISMIDPNGDVKDWFENEKTGEVMNVKGTSQLPSQEQDKNWVNIGKDDKFGKEDVPSGEVGSITKMNTNESKVFMSNQGFNLKLKEEVVIEKTTHYYITEADGGLREVSEPQRETLEQLSKKVTYINKKVTDVDIQTNHIASIETEGGCPIMTETNKTQKNYKYGQKPKREYSKEIDFASKILQFMIENMKYFKK